MKYPNFKEEKKLYKAGCNMVAGIDEAGRGPLAGPVIACAITLPQLLISDFKFLNINDSKKLSAKKREEIYEALKDDPDVEWGIGRVSEKVIDRINIFEATKLAMQRAVDNLAKKQDVDFLIIDGNFGIKCSIPQRSIIKGDQRVLSVAAASIVAKVTRDKMMINYHKRYPQYCFDKHKGYPTRYHKQIIKNHGLCQIHRKTFHVS
jgi:ribonuclease HII